MEESQSEEKSHEIRLQTKIKLRKRELEQKIFQSRLNSSNKKLVNHEELPMEAIEEPKETNEGFLPLNKCFRHNYRYKRERRCWKCGKTGHYKNRCPQIRCWYCGIKGHSKKRCFKRDLRIAINALKRMKDDGTRDKKPQKNKIDDRYKELEFIEKDNEIYMSSKGIDL